MENSRIAIAILKGGAVAEKEPIDEAKVAMSECAKGIMQAIKSGDTEMLKEHLYSFVELWQLHEDSETPSEEVKEHGGLSEYDKNIKESKLAWSFANRK